MEKISIIIPLGAGKEIENPESIEKQGSKVRAYAEFGSNPSENRNGGVDKARAEFVAFINGHTTLSEDWAKKVLEFFKKHRNSDIVGGPQLTPLEERGFAKISGYALASKFGAWEASNRYAGRKLVLNADETMLTSANLICRKKVFKKVKFDEKIYPGEDPKFISDAKKAGFKVAYSPEIIAYNKRRKNLPDLAKQIYNYGKTRPKKESLKETLKRPFFIIPSIFAVYLIILILLSMSNAAITGNVTGTGNIQRAYLLSLMPLGLYIIFNLGFSAANSVIHRNMPALFILPFVYLTIHLSYGAGFISQTARNIFK